MATYDLLQRYDPDKEGVISLSPAWVICVIRFKQRVTFSRTLMSSISMDGSEAAAERGQPLIITNDCVQVSTQGSKSSHVKNLTATLVPGQINYLSEIMPGDWVFAWMCQSRERAADIVQRIRKGEACNNWSDGLKFMGRVYSMRKTYSIDPGSGKIHVRYPLQANGFTEFNSATFWDPYLTRAEPFINTWMGMMGIAVERFLSNDGIDVNGAIPELVELLFGRGITKKAANPDGAAELQGITGLTTGEGEASFAYVVPTSVGKILGRRSRSKAGGVLAYADLLHAIYGVQKYEQMGGVTDTTGNSNGALFTPTSLKPMLGNFLPAIPQFNGKSVWAILNQYLNPAVNEMYTALRTTNDGKIMPTLVVRQLPFSTDRAEGSVIGKVEDTTSGNGFQITRSGSGTPENVTRFLELPRWKIPEPMLLSFDVGRSDALRFNFVHLSGQAVSAAQPNIFTYQLVRSPPIRDDQDIRRSGLAPDVQVVACGIEGQQKGLGDWMKIRADILMGQHLTLTGTITCFGIEEPICEGDNLEFDGVVFHIEAVSHYCTMISENGHKRFVTTLQLSHGMRATGDLEALDERLYAATEEDDFTGHDPGHTFEYAPAPSIAMPEARRSNNARLDDFFNVSEVG